MIHAEVRIFVLFAADPLGLMPGEGSELALSALGAVIWWAEWYTKRINTLGVLFRDQFSFWNINLHFILLLQLWRYLKKCLIDGEVLSMGNFEVLYSCQSAFRSKTEVITTALEESKIPWRPKGRENAGDQVVIGVRFALDWSREWREFSGPITEQSKAKPMESRIQCSVENYSDMDVQLCFTANWKHFTCTWLT